MIYKDDEGNTVRKTGVMGIVVAGGIIYPGDSIDVKFPSEPYNQLEYVW